MLVPLVSVVLPLFNCEQFIGEAINSILNQDFEDFELIVIDDCSTDRSYEIVKNISDKRIRLIRNTVNIGLNKSLNYGINLAHGKYIARMDHDDISLPNRFSVQVKFLETNPTYILVGSNCNFIDGYGNLMTNNIGFEQDDKTLKSKLFFACPFVHPGIMIRKSILDSNSVSYNENIKQAEDYVLYCTMMELGKYYTPPGILLNYREHQSIHRGTSLSNKKPIIEGRFIAWKIILQRLEVSVKDEILLLHDKFCYYSDEITLLETNLIPKYLDLLKELKLQNQQLNLFSPKHIEQAICNRVYNIGKFLIARNISIFPYAKYFSSLTNFPKICKLFYFNIIQ